jgi:methionyl-tRNA formyltransferase
VKSPVHKLAESAGIEVRTPRSLKDAQELEAFAQLKFDAAIVVAYGLILPVPVLEAPRLGCFNLHGSLLPRWRGAAPIQRAIMAGDAETGIMAMRMEEGLDTGPVLMTERVPIGRKTFGELHDELARLGADLLGRALVEIEHDRITAQPQDRNGITYARKIEKAEARIDWKRSARELDWLIRGLSPTPGAWFEAKGERIKVMLAEPVSGSGTPGEVLSPLVVACSDRALKLLTVQRAGRAPMDAEAFLRGFALNEGERLA